MNEKIPLPDPTPLGVRFLCSVLPTEIRDVIVRQCPPGTPARPRPDRSRSFPTPESPPTEAAGE
jgi:hypothetical protein